MDEEVARDMVMELFHKKTLVKCVFVGIVLGAFSLGSILGCSARRKTKGAVIGGVIGHYMDKQAEELAKIEGAKTERVGEEIKVTCDSAILFDFDSAMLKAESQDNIKKMADVFVKYPHTDIVIAGHTDSQGSEDYNQKLSERCATSVREYLVDIGVPPSRLQAAGYGELRPAASNDNEEGRRLNRRVEIEIKANEELKARAAEEEKQG